MDSIPVCLDPHTSHFLPSLESLYSSATETEQKKRLMVRKIWPFCQYCTRKGLTAYPADLLFHTKPLCLTSLLSLISYHLQILFESTSWMAVMTTCCTDSSIIIMVWMYSREKETQLWGKYKFLTQLLWHRHFHIIHTDKYTEYRTCTLFLFTVDSAAQDKLQHPPKFCCVRVFSDHANVW